jgi:hypothetical protein
MSRRARTHPDVITELFNWDDPQRYEWVVRGSGSTHHIMRLVGPLLGGGVIIPILSYLGAALVTLGLAFIYSVILTSMGIQRLGEFDKLSDVFRLWTGIGAIAILLVLTGYLLWLLFRGTPKKRAQAQSKLDELLSTSIGIVGFVLSNQLAFGFRGGVDSFPQWIGFFAQHVVRAVSLDFIDVLDVNFSDIEPSTWYARLGTVFFKFLVTAGLVDFLWVVYRRRFYSQTITGSVKECFWTCQHLLDRDTLEIAREGEIEPLEHPERCVTLVDFIEALEPQAAS